MLRITSPACLRPLTVVLCPTFIPKCNFAFGFLSLCLWEQFQMFPFVPFQLKSPISRQRTNAGILPVGERIYLKYTFQDRENNCKMGSHPLGPTTRLRLHSMSPILLSELRWHFGFLGINTNSELLSKNSQKVWLFSVPKGSVSLDKGPGPPGAGSRGKLIVYPCSHVASWFYLGAK